MVKPRYDEDENLSRHAATDEGCCEELTYSVPKIRYRNGFLKTESRWQLTAKPTTFTSEMTSTRKNQSTFDFVATWLRQTDPILSGRKPLSVLLEKYSLPSSAEAFQLASKQKSFLYLLVTLLYNKKTSSSNSPTTESPYYGRSTRERREED